MKISLLEPIGVPKETIFQLAQDLINAGHEFIYYDTKATDPAILAERSQDSDLVIIANNPYPAEVIEAAKNLKMLNVAFTGIDHIALEACRDRGIMVCNAANYSNQTVAELVLGLTISLLRFIPQGDQAVRSGGTAAGLIGREIAGRTVGIIGTGRIGSLTAKLFICLGAQVIAYSLTESAEVKAMGVRYVSLDTLMQESDIVSLHTSYNPSTQGLISAAKIALMKETAIFINCARGPIIDNAALAEALNNEAIAGAGIDVFDMEPPIPADYPLLQAKNTILTPHVAFASEESMLRRAEIVFQNIYAYLENKPQNVCQL